MNLSLTDNRIKLGKDFSFDDLKILPDMTQNQKKSFTSFLKNFHKIFNDFFPIINQNQTAKLEIIDYIVEDPKVDMNVCYDYSITYAVSMKIKVRLTLYDKITNASKVSFTTRDVKEQWVFFSDIPMMTENSKFIINGSDHVVISQMHRSPGVFFDHDDGKNYSSEKFLYSVSLIPYRGSWLDLEFDSRDLIYFRIDKKRKMPVTTLLRACGFETKTMLDFFYKTFKCDLNSHHEDYVKIFFSDEIFLNTRMPFDLFDKFTLEIVIPSGAKITKSQIRKISDKLNGNYEGEFYIKKEILFSLFLADDFYFKEEKISYCGKNITTKIFDYCLNKEETILNFYLIDHFAYNSYIIDTLAVDKNQTKDASLVEICRIVRDSDSSLDPQIARDIFNNMFFVPQKYDLSEVGRIKLNLRTGLKFEKEDTVLHNEDIVEVIKELIKVKDGLSDIDDIDNLSNRRVRLIGELVENQVKMGLMKLAKNAYDKMSSSMVYDLGPYDLIYSKFVSSSIREFFTLSQFSQFMDQTNPLSEITHKRRISALGVGGLNRDRAGFDVRDVHFTHYGRICPIETPEGANIGLINSLSVYAKIDDYGFIRTPYKKVENGFITNDVHYLVASDEINMNIAEINSEIDENNKLIGPKINCRQYGEYVTASPEEVNFIDVSSKQIVSVATSLIPFLDNDDANRALMGANMQRQAVPLLRSNAPIVGTGMESLVAKDSGVMILAEEDALVKYVDSNVIILEILNNENSEHNSSEDENITDSKIDLSLIKPNPLNKKEIIKFNQLKTINLKKYKRSNYNTSINQSPIVHAGQIVKKGDVLADGFGTRKGELALGDNILIAFLSWNGYNFEDSIIVSERLIMNDVFTSTHIEEFECVVRDTKFGEEKITRDIPNISDELLIKLDESGFAHIGSVVKPGDILVGKVMPKVDNILIPEEKLLRAVFGEGATDVADASLYLPPGVTGVVIDIKVLSRRGIEKDYTSVMSNRKLVDSYLKEMNSIYEILSKNYRDFLLSNFSGSKIKSAPKKFAHFIGEEINIEILIQLNHTDLGEILLDKSIAKYRDEFVANVAKIEERYVKYIKNLADGYGIDLPHGVLKIVKVLVATQLKLQPGDKMSGRHGNKGVVSIISPIEDMPFMEDGTPIDIILSPLGIPSRMNMGQVLEVHLGLALFSINRRIQEYISKKIEGWQQIVKNLLLTVYHRDKDLVAKINIMNEGDLIDLASEINRKALSAAIPVFSGVEDSEISNLLKLAGHDETGQVILYDGKTGEKIHRRVTVGIMYLLKLHHLVDNKIHARSIGPYSLVTQQPLGGRSHFGGQRFGEMECWALQAYGAAYTLQEILTIKSDDVIGRVVAYENIIKGEQIKECWIPESFNVIVKELLALCINVDFLDSSGKLINIDK
jgi:DNA-directed RNA polymerase subunit beta